MKNHFLLAILLVALSSCGSDSSPSENAEIVSSLTLTHAQSPILQNPKIIKTCFLTNKITTCSFTPSTPLENDEFKIFDNYFDGVSVDYDHSETIEIDVATNTLHYTPMYIQHERNLLQLSNGDVIKIIHNVAPMELTLGVNELDVVLPISGQKHVMVQWNKDEEFIEYEGLEKLEHHYNEPTTAEIAIYGFADEIDGTISKNFINQVKKIHNIGALQSNRFYKITTGNEQPIDVDDEKAAIHGNLDYAFYNSNFGNFNIHVAGNGKESSAKYLAAKSKIQNLQFKAAPTIKIIDNAFEDVTVEHVESVQLEDGNSLVSLKNAFKNFKSPNSRLAINFYSSSQLKDISGLVENAELFELHITFGPHMDHLENVENMLKKLHISNPVLGIEKLGTLSIDSYGVATPKIRGVVAVAPGARIWGVVKFINYIPGFFDLAYMKTALVSYDGLKKSDRLYNGEIVCKSLHNLKRAIRPANITILLLNQIMVPENCHLGRYFQSVRVDQLIVDHMITFTYQEEQLLQGLTAREIYWRYLGIMPQYHYTDEIEGDLLKNFFAGVDTEKVSTDIVIKEGTAEYLGVDPKNLFYHGNAKPILDLSHYFDL